MSERNVEAEVAEGSAVEWKAADGSSVEWRAAQGSAAERKAADGSSKDASSALPGIHALACRIHEACLRAYPSAFRREFGSEMNEVFRLRVIEAREGARMDLLELCLREIVDLPFHLFREHLDARVPKRGASLMHDSRCPRCQVETEAEARYCASCGHAFVGWRERMVDVLEPRLMGTPGWLRGALALMLAALAGLSAGHLVTALGLFFVGSYFFLGLVLLGFSSYVGRLLAKGGHISLTGRLARILLASALFGLGLVSVRVVDRVYLGSLMGTEHRSELALPGIRALTVANPDEAVIDDTLESYREVLHESQVLARHRSSVLMSEDGRLVTILLTESIDGIYSLFGILLAAAVATVAYRQAMDSRALRA